MDLDDARDDHGTVTVKPAGSSAAHKYVAAGFVLVLAVLTMARDVPVPSGDAPRYIDIGLNLAHHGVFSQSDFDQRRRPQPSLLEGGPLIGVELAAAALLDAGTDDTFKCVARADRALAGCTATLTGLKLLHLVELCLSFLLLWLIGRRIFADPWQAWLFCAVALAAREVLQFTGRAQTETQFFALYLLFIWSFARLGDPRRRLWDAFAAGAALGLATLAKPAMAPLAIAAPLILAAIGVFSGASWNKLARHGGAVFAGAMLLIGAWLARNWFVAGVLAIGDPFYLEATLSHRFAYNAMTWREWLIGWIYYLPDFGDQLAMALFSSADFVRLGWGPESFYVFGRDSLQDQVHAITGPAPAVGYLIKTYALSQPIKYSAVSLLLLWRGLFLSNYWGLAALLLAPWALRAMTPRQRLAMAFVGLPALAIAGIHAALSVSIARYNLALIPVYAGILTFTLLRIFERVGPYWRLGRGGKGDQF